MTRRKKQKLPETKWGRNNRQTDSGWTNGNSVKRLCVRLLVVVNTTWENLQTGNPKILSSVGRTILFFATCRFSQVVFITASNLTHNRYSQVESMLEAGLWCSNFYGVAFYQNALRTFESVIQREWNCVSAFFRWLLWSGGRKNRFDYTLYLDLPRLVLTGSLRWSKTLTTPSKVKWVSIYYRLIFAYILLTCITPWIWHWHHWSPSIDQQFLICVSVDKVRIQAEWR